MSYEERAMFIYLLPPIPILCKIKYETDRPPRTVNLAERFLVAVLCNQHIPEHDEYTRDNFIGASSI